MCEYRPYRFAAIWRWVRIRHLQHERLYDMNYCELLDACKTTEKTVNGWNECLCLCRAGRGAVPGLGLNWGLFNLQSVSNMETSPTGCWMWAVLSLSGSSQQTETLHTLWRKMMKKKIQSSAGLLFQTNSPCLEIQVTRPSMKTPRGSI